MHAMMSLFFFSGISRTLYAVLLLCTIADLVCLRLLSDPVSGVLRLKCVEDSVALQLEGGGKVQETKIITVHSLVNGFWYKSFSRQFTVTL